MVADGTGWCAKGGGGRTMIGDGVDGGIRVRCDGTDGQGKWTFHL